MLCCVVLMFFIRDIYKYTRVRAHACMLTYSRLLLLDRSIFACRSSKWQKGKFSSTCIRQADPFHLQQTIRCVFFVSAHAQSIPSFCIDLHARPSLAPFSSVQDYSQAQSAGALLAGFMQIASFIKDGSTEKQAQAAAEMRAYVEEVISKLRR